MLPVEAVPVVHRAQPRPRARGIGFVLVLAAAVLAPTLATSTLDGLCNQVPFLGTPAGAALIALIAIAGVVLLVGVPRTSAVAPALAVGASIPLLGGAVGGWRWLAQAPCVESLLDAPAAMLVLQAGASLAVIVVSWWLLYSRDEFEPWFGTRGVTAATVAAVVVAVVAIGCAALVAGKSGYSLYVVTLTCCLPWAVSVGLVGWLRRSPAAAVVVGALVQSAWLLLAKG